MQLLKHNCNTITKHKFAYKCNTYGRYNLVITHGHGSIVYDPEDNEYIDCVAGIAVNSIGHTHKKMTENLSKQLDKLIHVSNHDHK